MRYPIHQSHFGTAEVRRNKGAEILFGWRRFRVPPAESLLLIPSAPLQQTAGQLIVVSACISRREVTVELTKK